MSNREGGDLPLRSVAHRNNELQAHNQDTRVSQHDEDIFAHVVTEGIDLLVAKGASDEVECQVEVCLSR